MKRIRLLFVVVGAVQAAACAQYLDRKETVAFSAGNAVNTNVVTHVIDPWPAHVGNTRIVSNGERMQKSVERYRRNRVTDPGCAQSPTQGGPAPATSGGTPCTQPLPQGGGSPSQPAGAAAPQAVGGGIR